MLSIVGKRLRHRSLFSPTSLDVSTYRALISHFSSDSSDSASANKPPVTKESKKSKDGPEEGNPAQAHQFVDGTPPWVRELLAVRSKKQLQGQKKPEITKLFTKKKVLKEREPRITTPVVDVEEMLSKSNFQFDAKPKPKRKRPRDDVWKMTGLQLSDEVLKAADIIFGENHVAKKELLRKADPLLKRSEDLQNIEKLASATKDTWSDNLEDVYSFLAKSDQRSTVSRKTSKSVSPGPEEQFQNWALPGEEQGRRWSSSTPGWKTKDAEWNINVQRINDLFSKESLGIFDRSVFQSESACSSSVMKTWEFLEYKQLHTNSKYCPNNWWDECIQWTNEGKLWHFPINNEQGMEKEAEVSFAEHVFLDQHIEDWCPREGPIRHFMELVMVGLSKNYSITVEEKIENLNWYRDYFEKHRALLEEINALGSSSDPDPTEGTVSK